MKRSYNLDFDRILGIAYPFIFILLVFMTILSALSEKSSLLFYFVIIEMLFFSVFYIRK